MSKGDISAVERIIANTINETARGDPDALASRIVAALAEAGYGIVPANWIEDTALGPQPFDKLTREMRPQDHFGNGRDWTFRTGEHGGDEPDNMPQTIKATDAAGRWAIYVPLTRGGKIVVPRSCPETESSTRAETRQLYRSPNGDSWFLVRSRDRLGLRQAPGECAIRRSGDRYRSRRVPERPRKSRARSAAAPDWRINLQSARGRGR